MTTNSIQYQPHDIESAPHSEMAGQPDEKNEEPFVAPVWMDAFIAGMANRIVSDDVDALFERLFDDVSHLWEGEIEVVLPTIGEFSTGKHLFYDGETNELHGEGGISKTWIVLEVMRQEMAKGNHVVYLDPESNAKKIIGRLRILGAVRSDLFHYKSTSFEDDAAWLNYRHAIELKGVTVACLDGLVNFIAMRGSSEDDNAEAVKTLQTIARPLAQGGAAVIVIDHTAKNKMTKGARGAGAKRGFYKGASYHVKSKDAFSKAKSGYATLTIDKDNEGSVGAVGDVVAEFHCTVDADGSTFELCHPKGGIISIGAPAKMSNEEFINLIPVGIANRVPFENLEDRFNYGKKQFTAKARELGIKVSMSTDSSLTRKNHFWRESDKTNEVEGTN